MQWIGWTAIYEFPDIENMTETVIQQKEFVIGDSGVLSLIMSPLKYFKSHLTIDQPALQNHLNIHRKQVHDLRRAALTHSVPSHP